MSQRVKKNFGFTLVELLVVIGITATLGVIFTNTLVQTLRSQNKSRVLGQVKQNGQIVLDRLSSEIRQSERVICVDKFDSTDTITIFKDGKYERFRFHAPVLPPSPAVNGFIEWDEFTVDEYGDPDNLDPNHQDIEEACLTSALIAGRINYLTNRDTKNGISLNFLDSSENRAFIRSSKAGFGDIVTIQFKASEGVSMGALYENTVTEGGIPFITTVQVKGIKR